MTSSADSLRDTGRRLFQEGAYAEALEKLDQAYEAYKDEEQLVDAGEMLNDMGVIHRVEGNLAEAEKMLDQGFLPDVISSDIHIGLRVKTGGWPGMPPRDQPTTMSKMLSLGMSLDDVIRASTVAPAKVIGCENELGSLRRGSVADVSVLEVEEGRFEFNDFYSGTTVGNKKLTPLATILGGEILHNKISSS